MKLIKLLFLFLILLFPLVVVKPVFAGFGISPAEIYNDHLKPGAVFETEVVISRSEADEDLKVVIETELGEAESWIKFLPSKDFVFPKNEKRKTIKAIITVPKNAETKNYKGLLRIKASSLNSSGSGVSIVQGARMEVTLVTTSLNVNILSVKGTRLPDVDWQQPLKLFANIENSGNTEIAPEKIILEIQDLNKSPIETLETTKIEKIGANTTKEIFVEFINKLPGGEYFGIVKIFSDGREIYSDRLVFRVRNAPPGANQQIASTGNNKIIFKHIAFPLILLVPILVAYLIRKKTKNKNVKRICLIFIVLYVIIVTILIYLFHQKLKSDMAKPGDIGNVQGESVEITPTTIPKVVDNSASLVVNKEDSGYPLYRTPDINSEVVYIATENEKLSVIEEVENWFRVSTGDGTGGWLPKTSVKKTE